MLLQLAICIAFVFAYNYSTKISMNNKRLFNNVMTKYKSLRLILYHFAIGLVLVFTNCSRIPAEKLNVTRPNIVIILCDDLGYGDVKSLNTEKGKIQTPFIDKLGEQGIVFTDAHSASSVCTPTRYGLLTGRYSWRTRLQQGVVNGYNNCLIDSARTTIAEFLKEHGYQTAIVGKWHLNFNYKDQNTGKILKRPADNSLPLIGTIIQDGPTMHGFDYFHGYHHSQEMSAIINNDKVVEHDDVINMLPRITKKSIVYIENIANNKSDKPFFLYVALSSPHTPLVPSPDWQGKSGISPYADFVMQTDASVGAIMKALDDNKIGENTLVFFTSDNGCSKAADIEMLQNEFDHYPSAFMRGSKSDIWDGGHRVPFIVKWPAVIDANSHSNHLLCLNDIFKTCADIINEPLPVNAGEDSFSFKGILTGDDLKNERTSIIHHSISGHFAIREGKWKLCLAKGSGGWTFPREKDVSEKVPVAQLYNMELDEAETTNLYNNHPEIADRLYKSLKEGVENGRTTNGVGSENDLSQIILWKSGQ